MTRRRLPGAGAFLALLALGGAAACRPSAPSGGSGGGANTATPAVMPTAFPGAAKLGETQRLASEGKLAEAADALAAARLEIETAAPLGIRNLTPVEGPVRGYGLYTAKSDTSFLAGEPLVLYFEPFGMSYRREPDGRWTHALAVDVALLDAAGNPILARPDFLKSEATSHQPNRELQFTITLGIEGAPAGDYVAEIRLRDTIGGESAVRRMPFSIRLP